MASELQGLEQVFEQYVARINRGERLDSREIHTRYPEYAAVLLERLKLFERIDGTFDDGDLGSLADYTILRQVGRGGMGVVYEAWENSMHRRVALKVLPMAVAADARAVTRFVREARVAGNLQHPNVVPVFAMGVKEKTPYYAMEFVDGMTVAEILEPARQGDGTVETPFGADRDDPAFYSEVARCFVEVTEGLHHAHSRGVIHRDIKPSNLILEGWPRAGAEAAEGSAGAERSGAPAGRLRILDFGLARLEGQATLTLSGGVVGTPAYMSPEQASRQKALVDHRTDIYSLGATLYEVLTLHRPFEGQDAQETLTRIIDCDPPAPRHLNRSVPPDLETIVLKAMEKKPRDRYATAQALAADLDRFLHGEPILARPPTLLGRATRWTRRNLVRVGLAAGIVLAVGTLSLLGWRYRAERVENRETQWLHARAIPGITKEIEGEDFLAAFLLAREAERRGAQDATLAQLQGEFSRIYSFTTDPPGVDVFCREYADPAAAWIHFGQTPLNEVRIPQGIYRWKLEKDGFESREFMNQGGTKSRKVHLQMFADGTAPPGMVYVDEDECRVQLTGYRGTPQAQLPAYWIDRHEVTNAQFKEFVDQGGYRRSELWQEPFTEDGKTLAWEVAMPRFHDRAGLPGPSTWQDGTYPQGQESYPVSGVSWYEAAAYARFRGKSLPTIFHWSAHIRTVDAVFRASNFGGAGPAAVGTHPAITPLGLYDMAGNVKEWCHNATDESGAYRYALGGAWSDPTYLFFAKDTRSPWERSPVHGFRCVRYPGGRSSLPDVVLGPLDAGFPRDYGNVAPISEGEFQFYKNHLYSYDQTSLNVEVESVDDESEHWRRERVTLDAAYGEERLIVVLYLPKGYKRPYQTVVYHPGGGASRLPSIDEQTPRWIRSGFLLQSGRALICPVFKGTYERRSKFSRAPTEMRDLYIQKYKDMGRTLDYLATRDDIDAERIAYYGSSWGAWCGPLFLAVDNRLKLAVLSSGGLWGFYDDPFDPLPSRDPFHFIPRISVPVLMLNGEYDAMFPLGESQQPMFELLGTAASDKKHVLYPAGHGISDLFRRQIGAEVLAWLDRYFGEPERES